MEISIRSLSSPDEYIACEDLQRSVWAMPDDLEVVPLHLLVAVQRSGGLLLGAFDGSELVGFVFGLTGLAKGGKVKHYSHMMGVAPGYQSAGIGYRLKLAQRGFVLSQGIDLVTWTYDPLESRNAYLNIHKLGAVSRTYIRDCYGPLTDGLSAGLPSDRLQADWWIASAGTEQRQTRTAATPHAKDVFQVNETGRTVTGLLTPGVLRLDTGTPLVQVEIPADYQSIKGADSDLALAWRHATREVFEFYFAADYSVVDFHSRLVEETRRSFYVLQAE
jgi:predicted GNAT superfamily acetyltransferase